jgi:hypothetical protein
MEGWMVERRRRWLFRYALVILALTLSCVGAMLAGDQELTRLLALAVVGVAGCYLIWVTL